MIPTSAVTNTPTRTIRKAMSKLGGPLKWFYTEFGLQSIQITGRNAYLIIIARTLRMFAYGTNALILALFFAELKFTDFHIGLFMTLTLLGDVVLGLWLTLIADRVGRRRVLLLGSFMMVVTGLVFAVFENFWILLLAAIVGVVSATGGDYGPFRSIEESILSQLTTPATRSDVLSWYITASTLGSSIGSEASGRIMHYLESLDGWSLRDSYHTLFLLYAIMGSVNAALCLMLSKECELNTSAQKYRQIQQDERADDQDQHVATRVKHTSSWNLWAKITGQLSEISSTTRSIMYKLWFLLAVDSIADGMVPYTLTNYYMDKKFHPSKSTLGDVTSISYFLGAISSVFAGPCAKRIGLINTMVFTHVPSSAAVLFFPAPNNLIMTVILLFIRAGLNNMDQAPRSAFIAAVVRQEERTAAMGITSMVRTLAAMAGPSITGALAGSDRFWIAFVVGGSFRLAYDLGLYVMFVNIKLYQNEPGADEASNDARIETLEMGSLASSQDGDHEDDDDETLSMDSDKVK